MISSNNTVFLIEYLNKDGSDIIGRIEIDDLNDLINKHYPLEYINKIIEEVLRISMLVKDDYPDYRHWFLNKHMPGIYDGKRNSIIAHIDNQVVGFVSLKKDISEKKICTFYVSKVFRKNKIGSILALRAIKWLECDKPLITIPANKLGDFIWIAKRYNWIVTDIKDGLYRTNNPEVIVNGSIVEYDKEADKSKIKSLPHIWFFYHITKIKNNLLSMKRFLKRVNN